MSRRIIRGPIVLLCALALALLLMPALAQAHAGSGLVVKRVSIAPSSVAPGGQITVTDLTKNTGTAPAKPSRTAYLLSVDTRASKDDVVLGYRKVPALRPRKSSKGSLTVTLDPQTKAGTYHVLACAGYRSKAKAHKGKGSCRAPSSVLMIGPIPGPGGPSPGKPAAATCTPGAGTPAEGIDVSEFDGTIDFAKVAEAGVRFVYARADDGMLFSDPNYATYKANATSAGLLFGAYQFFEPSQDPVAQAERFLHDASLGSGNLFPALVVETTGGLSPSELEQHIASWLATVQAAFGVKPLIYTAKAIWDPSVQPGLAAQGYPLWVANWEVSSPTLPSEWSSWAFWQYKDNGTVSGISGPVDRDRFDGAAPCTIG